MPEISIILPFYNAKQSLNKCCESIAVQTFNNFECIMINNNSKDNSCQVAFKWTQKDKRFKLLNENKQGVAHASVLGSRNAMGRFIARMDADDIMLPDRLKLQYDFLEQNSDFDVVGGMVKFGGNVEKAKGIKRFVDWTNNLITFDDILLNQFAELPIVNPTLMWRKQIEHKFGGYKHGDFPEDYELMLRWLSEGVKMAKVEKEVIVWNDPPQRLTRNDERYSFDAFYKTKAKYLRLWLKKHNSHFPNVYVWGASRLARKRASYLIDNGINIIGYIDISEKRDVDENIIYYEDIPTPDTCFIVIYTPQLEIKTQIKEYLEKRYFKLGINFIFAA